MLSVPKAKAHCAIFRRRLTCYLRRVCVSASCCEVREFPSVCAICHDGQCLLTCSRDGERAGSGSSIEERLLSARSGGRRHAASRVGSFRLSSSSYSSRRFSQTASARCTLRGLSRSPLLAASLQIYPKESRLWLGLLGLGAASDFLRGYPTIRPRFSPCLVSSPFS